MQIADKFFRIFSKFFLKNSIEKLKFYLLLENLLKIALSEIKSFLRPTRIFPISREKVPSYRRLCPFTSLVYKNVEKRERITYKWDDDLNDYLLPGMIHLLVTNTIPLRE